MTSVVSSGALNSTPTKPNLAPLHCQLGPRVVRQVRTGRRERHVVYRLAELGDVVLQRSVEDVIFQQLLRVDVVRDSVLEQRLGTTVQASELALLRLRANLLTYLLQCFQCFYAVGWAAGRASGL